MKTNITLIGMPASGKSTIGVLLAKRLGYSFVDVDIVIQEKTGKLLKEIIAEEGPEGFLKVEEKVNRLHQAIRELERDLEHKVTKEEVSAFLGMPLAEIEDLLRMAGDGLELE